jgi:hypothetical protein
MDSEVRRRHSRKRRGKKGRRRRQDNQSVATDMAAPVRGAASNGNPFCIVESIARKIGLPYKRVQETDLPASWYMLE